MSNVNVETLLYEELEREFDKLNEIEPGSNEYKVIVDGLTKLMDKKIEMDRVDNDCEHHAAALESEERMKREQLESEERMKQKQLDDENKDRLIKNIIGAAGIVLPLIVTIWGTKVSLKFEEEGTFTTIMGRGFINKLLPKK